jgi:prepilin signal peptidase PulO-like enzyme (type II secretory pathway)
LVGMMFEAAMVCVIVIDWQYMVIPDAICLPGILAGMAWTLALPKPAWLGHTVAGPGCALVLLGADYASRRALGRPLLGRGDMTLLAMLGLFLGPHLVWWAWGAGLVGQTLGSFRHSMRDRGRPCGPVPIGAFLAAGASVAWFLAPQ